MRWVLTVFVRFNVIIYLFILHLVANVIHYAKETAPNRRVIFQYPWNDSELYLFRATVAYALRQYYSQQNKVLNFT